MHKTHITSNKNASPALCHLPNTFFKDLQTNFPETFHAISGIHHPCFTSPVSTKNHPIYEAPQHTPATALTSIPQNFFRLLSPSILLIHAQTVSPNNALSRPHKRVAPVRAPNGAPGCSHGCSVVGHRPTSAIRGQHQRKNPTPAGVQDSLECAQKTTQTAQHRNPCPPQALPQSPKAVCHYMSPSISHDLRAISAPVFTLDPLAPQPLGPFFFALCHLRSGARPICRCIIRKVSLRECPMTGLKPFIYSLAPIGGVALNRAFC